MLSLLIAGWYKRLTVKQKLFRCICCSECEIQNLAGSCLGFGGCVCVRPLLFVEVREAGEFLERCRKYISKNSVKIIYYIGKKNVRRG